MKLDKKVDYGYALKSLFEGLKSAEKVVKGNDDYKYANAYGRASMAIKMHLVVCTDLTFDDIYKELNPGPNDIPNNLYISPSLSKQLDDEEAKELFD